MPLKQTSLNKKINSIKIPSKKRKGKQYKKHKTPRIKSPTWESITPELEDYIEGQITKNKKFERDLRDEHKRKDRLNKLTFNFLKKVQSQGRFNKTAWKKGGATLLSHGLYVASIRGKLNHLFSVVRDTGTIRTTDIKRLKQTGKFKDLGIPVKLSAGNVITALRTGKVKHESGLKIARVLGYSKYTREYERKINGKLTRVSGYFSGKK